LLRGGGAAQKSRPASSGESRSGSFERPRQSTEQVGIATALHHVLPVLTPGGMDDGARHVGSVGADQPCNDSSHV